LKPFGRTNNLALIPTADQSKYIEFVWGSDETKSYTSYGDCYEKVLKAEFEKDAEK
jgi:hypothetical protein